MLMSMELRLTEIKVREGRGMMVEPKHWKIYRGSLRHRVHGNTLFWSTSEEGIKTALRRACREDDQYEKPGSYSYVYIPPTKRGLVEWLERNVTLDNG